MKLAAEIIIALSVSGVLTAIGTSFAKSSETIRGIDAVINNGREFDK